MVASALIEMGDHETAIRHLESLRIGQLDEFEKHDLSVMETFAWIKVGYLERARNSLSAQIDNQLDSTIDQSSISGTDYREQVLGAIVKACGGNFRVATEEWTLLHQKYPEDPLIRQNLAVCQLYNCEIDQSQEVLEDILTDSREIFQAILFNLATIYELSAENSQALKTSLAERVKIWSRNNSTTTQERPMADFKL